MPLIDVSGKLVTYDKVIDILANESVSYVDKPLSRRVSEKTLPRLPLSTLATTLFPFFRHTITNVRLSVVNTLNNFMSVPSLPRDWIAAPFLQLLLQNLVVEERTDIREASLSAWRNALLILASSPDLIDAVVKQNLILDWYTVTMTPLGVAIDASAFYRPTIAHDGAAAERHNVDKNMLAQDLSLIPVEVTLKARVAAATALAHLIAFWPHHVCARSLPENRYTHTTEVIGQDFQSVLASLHRFSEHASEVPGCCHRRRVGARIRRCYCFHATYH
jgi:TATA-binding protein-associated factor